MNEWLGGLEKPSRLILGTAALGLDYGVANSNGMMSDQAAAAVLDRAWAGGINTIDTATAYGVSEQRLGNWMSVSGVRPQLISKLPPLACGDRNACESVAQNINHSLQVLGVKVLDGYLVHSARDFLRSDVRDALVYAREAGTLRAIGVSAYEPDEVFAALETGQVDMVQAPLNLIDRRMIESGATAACRDRGVAVFARSVFVQGALLMAVDNLPAHLMELRPVLISVNSVAEQHGISASALLLSAVLSQNDVDSVVVGVHCVAQLDQLLRASTIAVHGDVMFALACEVEGVIANLPKRLVDPRTWPPSSG